MRSTQVCWLFISCKQNQLTISADSQQNYVLIAAGITGLLFGIHPLHVESVAWVAERKDLLYSLFYLLGLITYLNFSRAENIDRLCFGSRHYYTTFALFILSLSSKPMAITLPLVLLLLDWYPLERLRSGRTLLLRSVEKLPFLILSVTVSLITTFAQKSVGALTLNKLTSLTDRVLIALHSVIFYLWKTFLPTDLLPFYPYPRDISLGKPEYLAALVLFSAITCACIFVVRKQPAFLAAWGFFLITVLPVLGLIQAGVQSASDHYVYLSVAGIFLLIGAGLAILLTTGTQMKHFNAKRLGIVSAVVLTATFFSYLTVKQIGTWKNSIELWSNCIEIKPGLFPEMYYLRGLAFSADGQIKLAIKDYTEAITLDANYKTAYFDRGLLFLANNRSVEAVADFRKVIAISPADADAYNNLGKAYEMKQEKRLAVENYSQAIALDPENDEAYFNRGLLFMSEDKFNKAIDDFNRAIEVDPGEFDSYVNRGNAYLKKGDLKLAFADYSSVTAKWPNEYAAYVNRGIIYSLKGDFNEAMDDFNRALFLKPDAGQAYLSRGDLFAKIADVNSANKDYDQACRLGSEAGCIKARIEFPASQGSSVPYINFDIVDKMINDISNDTTSSP